MNRIIDFIINKTRWLIAIYLLLSVPALISSWQNFNFFTVKFYALYVGIGFYAFTLVASSYNMRSSMQIIAHELTHTFFSYLTLHLAGRIRLNPDGSGGSMALKGEGNWLISLSPYFFPLFAFLYMLIMPFLVTFCEGFSLYILYAILEYFLAYYWSTVCSQVHSGQTDIINEGYLFSALIIVGGNLYVTGSIFAYTTGLWPAVEKYVLLVHKINLENYLIAKDLIMQYI